MHAEFLDSLVSAMGSTQQGVADRLGVSAQQFHMWKGRGVSRGWRPTVAALAGELNVTLPDGFLEPPKRQDASPEAAA